MELLGVVNGGFINAFGSLSKLLLVGLFAFSGHISRFPGSICALDAGDGRTGCIFRLGRLRNLSSSLLLS